MSGRRVVLYWACFALLSGYYVLMLREPPSPAAAHLARAPFLNIAADTIDGLELRRGSSVIRCRRVGGRWQVLEPAGSLVPSDLVTALVTNLSQLPDVEVVAEGNEDLSQFGLNPPVSQIVLTPDGGHTVGVRLGSRNPAGTAVYAQHGDGGRVYLIGLNVRYYEDLLFEAVRPHPPS
jgi:Domain of unknown function (DUF4340)